MARQYARPNGDVDIGGWRNQLFQTDNLWAGINEPTPNAANKVVAIIDQPGIYEFTLSAIVDPQTSGAHYLRVTHLKNIVASGRFRLNLYSAGVLAFQSGWVTPAIGPWVTTEFLLPGAAADAITDYALLRCQIEGDDATDNGSVWIDQVELEVAGLPRYFTGIGDVPSEESVGDVTLGDVEQLYGVVDDLRWWDHIPSDDEVTDRALRELDGTEDGLLLYLRFAEGTGPTAFDSSPSGLDGTLRGSAQWVGLEGGPELVGQRKRRVFGIKRQLAGVQIDSQRLVWQVNAGPTHSIVPKEAAYATLASDGDFEDVYDWVPVAGHYATQLSEGLCRFGVQPAAHLSFDVEGDVDPEHGYTAVTAYIMRNIVVRGAGLTGADDVDDGAVLLVAAARPDAVGVATGSSAESMASVLNQLAEGIDGWWTSERAGRWTLGVRGEPSLPDFVLSEGDLVEGGEGLRRVAGAPPVRRWELTYCPYEVTMPTDEVNATIPAEQRGQFSKATRLVQTIDLEEVARRNKAARRATGATLYDQRDAARREANRRLEIDRYGREVYEARLVRGLYQYHVGQDGEVRLDEDRLLLGIAGQRRLYRVGGYDEDAAGSATIYMWGRVFDRIRTVGLATQESEFLIETEDESSTIRVD